MNCEIALSSMRHSTNAASQKVKLNIFRGHMQHRHRQTIIFTHLSCHAYVERIFAAKFIAHILIRLRCSSRIPHSMFGKLRFENKNREIEYLFRETSFNLLYSDCQLSLSAHMPHGIEAMHKL